MGTKKKRPKQGLARSKDLITYNASRERVLRTRAHEHEHAHMHQTTMINVKDAVTSKTH